MDLIPTPSQFALASFLFVLLSGCRTATPEAGYEYTVQSEDTLEGIAAEFRDHGVEVTVKEILAANPKLHITTNLIPEAGVQLFIPGQKATDSQTQAIRPRLVVPIEFANFTVSDIDSRGAIRLMDEKIKTGTDDPNPYPLLTLSGTNIQVETVNQYRQAIKAGYSTEVTADIAAESWFSQADRVLEFMAQAKPSKQSLFTVEDLINLPVSILNWVEGEEGQKLKKDARNGRTLKNCIPLYAPHHIWAVTSKDNTLTFCDDGCEYNIRELARGDVDGDGFEDALIIIATSYKGGSGRYYGTSVVSRTDPKLRQLTLKTFELQVTLTNQDVGR